MTLRVSNQERDPLTASDVLAMATLEGAEAMGLTGWSGPWSRASGPTWPGLRGGRPGYVNDSRQQVVYYRFPADVADL